jgi:hypothetical protein
MKYNLKAVGADPEFFLLDTKTHKALPSIGLIGGTKEDPVFINKDGFSAIQEDNVMVEFNIKPAKTAEEFVENTRLVFNYLRLKCQMAGATPVIVPHMQFEPEQLNNEQAMAIGCLGDHNAWSRRPNPQIDANMLGTVRVAGGHVHVSYSLGKKSPDIEDRIQIVRFLDLGLGVPSILLDKDKVRRNFYGKAGSYRPKPYGVEYRTLSNFLIENNDLMEWVFNQVLWSFRQVNKEQSLTGDTMHDIQLCINSADQGIAERLVKQYHIELPNHGTA